MPRRRRREGGAHGYMEQDHPPATGHRRRRREEEAPSHSLPPPPPLQEQQPSASLPDDVLIEILSRVPYRSLCRFRCVSKPWLALCSDPDVRRRSPQTLPGFFCRRSDGLHFRNLSGRGPPLVDPSLPFLRGSYERFYVVQCCISLLLCRCWRSCSEEDEYDYVVCNPATEEWTALPPIALLDQEDFHRLDLYQAYRFLGFDAAVPSRFVVFAPLINRYGEFKAGATYSSETGRWTSVQSERAYETDDISDCVFLNDTMHLTTPRSSIVAVDMEGKAWREMMLDDMADSQYFASIGQSQGRLYAWHIDDCQLSVWVLEDYISGQWTLKHTVNVLELFGRHCREHEDEYYRMFAIHPDCNLIFLTDFEGKTVSYDMDNRKVHVICTSGEFLGDLPYIPCFVEWSSDGH